MTTLYTIGHSTHAADAFASILGGAGVRALVDIRRFPASRRQPQFNVDALKRVLFQAGIQYVYQGDELGGFRDARLDSRHFGLAGSSFQGFADHMETPLFHRGYTRLLAMAKQAPTAVMCAEQNPKKCHRRLLSDRLTLEGMRVVHILDRERRQDHELSPTAHLEDGQVVYRRTALEDFAAPAAARRHET